MVYDKIDINIVNAAVNISLSIERLEKKRDGLKDDLNRLFKDFNTEQKNQYMQRIAR